MGRRDRRKKKQSKQQLTQSKELQKDTSASVDEEVSTKQKTTNKYKNIMEVLRSYFPRSYRDKRKNIDFKINHCLDTNISYSDNYPIKQLFKNGNDIFVQLESLGAVMWLNAKGDFCYRLSQDGEVIVNSLSKASIVFSNLLKKNV